MRHIVADSPTPNGTTSTPITSAVDRLAHPPTEAELLAFASAYPTALKNKRSAETRLINATTKLAQITALLGESTREENRG